MSVGIESGFSNDEVLNSRFPLHRACRDGDVGALCSLLQLTTTRDLVQEDSFYGWTPIHWAAHFGKLECVMRLVQVGCEVNTMTTRFAQTPVHIAAFGGHPDCVLWLLQAGADINRQDYVGETPIHKAARAGSLECINALLMQAAKPDLTNASGLTPADLARAQGFREGAQLLSNAQNHVRQLNGLHAHSVLNGNGLGGSVLRGAANRKRMLDGMESSHIKKARTDGLALPFRMQGCGGEDVETMHLDCAPEPVSDDPKAGALSGPDSSTGPHRTPEETPENGLSPGGVESEEARRGLAADMCGSLHQTGSPSSCVSQRPSWGDPALHYGHYHGFGDTAEDLAHSGGRPDRGTGLPAQRYQQVALGPAHLY